MDALPHQRNPNPNKERNEGDHSVFSGGCLARKELEIVVASVPGCNWLVGSKIQGGRMERKNCGKKVVYNNQFPSTGIFNSQGHFQPGGGHCPCSRKSGGGKDIFCSSQNQTRSGLSQVSLSGSILKQKNLHSERGVKRLKKQKIASGTTLKHYEKGRINRSWLKESKIENRGTKRKRREQKPSWDRNRLQEMINQQIECTCP